MAEALMIEVDGGYGSDGPFVVGFGASNQMAAMMGKAEYRELRLSFTPEQARIIGEALVALAAKFEG